MYDVVIVGGGPAGLNAALILGRCRRDVLLCDSGEPRNQRSARVSGFLSRDGCQPADLRRIGRDQLRPYESVEVRDVEVEDIEGRDGDFRVRLAGGEVVRARKVILATGLVDHPPPIPGAAELFGRGVWTCPYCDGWELRGKPLAVYGRDDEAVGFAVELALWSDDVVLFSDGPAGISAEGAARLRRAGIPLDERPIERLEADGDGGLACLVLADGARECRRGLFYMTQAEQRSSLAEALGCEIGDRGTAQTSSYEKTNVPGVWVAGDASRRVQFAIVAAAEGAMAAFAVNTELLHEDSPRSSRDRAEPLESARSLPT